MPNFYPIKQDTARLMVFGVERDTGNFVWCATVEELADVEQTILDLAASDNARYAYFTAIDALVWYAMEINDAE